MNALEKYAAKKHLAKELRKVAFLGAAVRVARGARALGRGARTFGRAVNRSPVGVVGSRAAMAGAGGHAGQKLSQNLRERGVYGKFHDGIPGILRRRRAARSTAAAASAPPTSTPRRVSLPTTRPGPRP